MLLSIQTTPSPITHLYSRWRFDILSPWSSLIDIVSQILIIVQVVQVVPFPRPETSVKIDVQSDMLVNYG